MLLLFFLMIKHFVFDFCTQNAYQYLNKGKFGHPGGLLHTSIHMIASFLILNIYGICIGCSKMNIIFGLVAAEGIIHYHSDWGKVQICRIKGWTANNSEWYWYLLGLDQLLHNLTYLGMSYLYGL